MPTDFALGSQAAVQTLDAVVGEMPAGDALDIGQVAAGLLGGVEADRLAVTVGAALPAPMAVDDHKGPR